MYRHTPEVVTEEELNTLNFNPHNIVWHGQYYNINQFMLPNARVEAKIDFRLMDGISDQYFYRRSREVGGVYLFDWFNRSYHFEDQEQRKIMLEDMEDFDRSFREKRRNLENLKLLEMKEARNYCKCRLRDEILL